MASYALLIGVDAYRQESHLQPLRTAADAARSLGTWLAEQGWVAPEHIRLLCAPPELARGERPATVETIADALRELGYHGAQAEPEDRLYLLFAGYGIGYADEQLLLLPEDAVAGAYSESVLPWAELGRWLRGCGFQTQFCFVATSHADDEALVDTLSDARLPLDWLDHNPARASISQHRLWSSGPIANDSDDEPPAIFASALRAGLGGVAASIDLPSAELVVRIEALCSYLEEAIRARSNGRLRCVATHEGDDNPVVARLGPAPHAELLVEIQPHEAATHATVALYAQGSETAVETRKGPPFRFEVVQNALYTMVAHAPDYRDEVRYGRAAAEPHTIEMRRTDSYLGTGMLGPRGGRLAELLIQPGEPALPVRLFNSVQYPIKLPPKKPRGYVVKTPPDRYRAVLVTPERNVEREADARAGEVTTMLLPLSAAEGSRSLDRLLAAVDRGHILNVRPTTNQAALVVLANEFPGPIAITPAGAGERQLMSPAQVPPDVVSLLRHGSVGPPSLTWLTFQSTDGEQYQLLVPLLPGRTTVVGLDGVGAGLPMIELLVTEAPLRRPHISVQRRILWAQRFFKAERRAFVPLLTEELDDQPLALSLAGYASLTVGDASRARTCARRLQFIAPTSGDGPILLAGAEGLERPGLITAPPLTQLPTMLAGLQYLVARAAPTTQHPLAPLLLRSVVLSQMWVVMRGDAVALAADQPEERAPASRHQAVQYSSQQRAVAETPPETAVDVLLITVTDIETRAVLNQFSRVLRRPYTRRFIGDNTYYALGSVGGANTILVQSEMGSGGPGGATLTAAASIDALRPTAIIMVGIAFGINPQQQRIGDVLVAKQLLAYELQRVGTSPTGAPQIYLRGERPPCSIRLLDRLHSSAIDWTVARVHFGLILSGDKLIDQQEFRDQLHSLAPEAIGGEMEGAGVYAAAQRRKVDWIVVKAVCDYADGHKNLDKDKRQTTAARNAARFVLHALLQSGFSTNSERGDLPVAPASSGGTTQPINQDAEQGRLLWGAIDQHFNDSELHALCFQLGINYESLNGENKSDKVRELVAYAELHGRGDELVALCRRRRPNAAWSFSLNGLVEQTDYLYHKDIHDSYNPTDDRHSELLAMARQMEENTPPATIEVSALAAIPSPGGTANEADVRFQQEQLKLYRANLRHYITQSGTYGGTSQVPIHIFNGIEEQRENIRRIKSILRGLGVEVVDYPEEVE